MLKGIPSRVESIVGRFEDVKNALAMLRVSRMVTITGEPGMGKTAVAKEVANYLKDREGQMFKNGVLFINVYNVSTYHMLVSRLVQVFVTNTGNLIKHLDHKTSEMLFTEVIAGIEKRNMLLIIDEADDLLQIDKEILKEFLERLLEGAPNFKLLLTSQMELSAFMGGLKDVQEHVLKLKPLSALFSEKLLCERAGKSIS